MAKGTFDRDVAILQGGPRDRWSYYVDDLVAARAAALAMGYAFDYRATRRYVTHPLDDDVAAVVWEYAPPPPDTAMPAEPRNVSRETKPPPTFKRWAEDLAPVPCPNCGEPTFRIEHHGSVLVVDTSIVRGGLWRFDERGRPTRRSIADVYREEKDQLGSGGYPDHECAQPTEPSRGAKD